MLQTSWHGLGRSEAGRATDDLPEGARLWGCHPEELGADMKDTCSLYLLTPNDLDVIGELLTLYRDRQGRNCSDVQLRRGLNKTARGTAVEQSDSDVPANDSKAVIRCQDRTQVIHR